MLIGVSPVSQRLTVDRETSIISAMRVGPIRLASSRRRNCPGVIAARRGFDGMGFILSALRFVLVRVVQQVEEG